jgi:hypothetical protein
MRSQHTDCVIFAAVAGQFAALGEEIEVAGAVPLLDDVSRRSSSLFRYRHGTIVFTAVPRLENAL